MPHIIDLIATGSNKNREVLEKSVLFIEKLGFKPRVSKTIFGTHPLYVNTDENRLQNLTQALYAEDSEIIWCLRGGSGTTRLLPALDTLPAPQKQKMVIGFSDVTGLLLFLSKKWGWQGVHAPTVSYPALNRLTPDALDALVQLIQGKAKELRCENLKPLNLLAQKESVIEGILAGGNLSLVEYSLGTSWQIESKSCILFFEDLNEPAYRIAERLEHLRQAGIFKGVKAILFGDFSHESSDKNRPDLVDFVLQDFAERLSDIPCLSNLPVGHKDFCRPLLINAQARLITGLQGSLTQKVSKPY